MAIRPLMLVPPLIFAALAAMFYIGMRRDNPDALPSVFVGTSAPPVALTPLGDLAGFSDADLRAPGIKLVNFWASWCAPCRVEHPNLTALRDEGFAIYGVNYKDDPDKALGFLAELGNPYAAMGQDREGRAMAPEWGVYGVPETFVIDAEGKVLTRFAGPVTQRGIAEKLRPFLKAAPAD
ncbi:DsbE family thiol:disulfide interchange protein [Pseudooceanicola sp.]|uniref:DsbE family thiol:disulfide interchange protein n=1 Tax=Pseudooceanicola sp. TaxID=1914328 RepID=UPI00261B9F32|nr:DsbE family thiol:disulfide interchange protein [Pseudooceanicola sp.]MDF1856870.1 DsbE family thiol:disulfide interchange protein [Pseudooceanicola sp.]